MLQHVPGGRRTNIDTLKGALVREAEALSIPVPRNESMVALLEGRELHERRKGERPALDYDAWWARVAAKGV
jgi:ketopantoate reductase